METREVKFEALGNLDKGQIWATNRHGVFVVVSARSAQWRGEDRDVYAHIDTWYTIREATGPEKALWNEAVEAVGKRRELRDRLGAGRSHQYDPAKRQLVSAMAKLDSYDDRWNPPAPIDLDDEAVTIEEAYIAALEKLHGHA